MNLIECGVKKLELLQALEQLKADLEKLGSVESVGYMDTGNTDKKDKFAAKHLDIIKQFTDENDIRSMKNILKYPSLGELKRRITDLRMGPDGFANMNHFEKRYKNYQILLATGKKTFDENIRKKEIRSAYGLGRKTVFFDFKRRKSELREFSKYINCLQEWRFMYDVSIRNHIILLFQLESILHNYTKPKNPLVNYLYKKQCEQSK